MSLRGWALAASLLLAGCGGAPALVDRGGPAVAEYSYVDDPIQCVPYARDVSGIPIRGDAWTWWDQAAGVYDRGHWPEPGSVLVLGARGRLTSGHLAVVTHVLDPRTVLVTQSNWGNSGSTRRRIYRAQTAVDVSSGNDWSDVRFYNPDTRAFGSVYSADGFIYPRRRSA